MSVREVAHGKWPELLKHFGVGEKFLRKTHGPCPICKGTDRYRFTDYKGNGEWFCTYCGKNDGMDLLMALTGDDFRTCAERVEEALGQATWVKTTPAKAESDPRRALNNIWRHSRPVRAGDETHRYLRGRGLTVLPPTLRTHPGILVGGRVYPAMLAMVVNVHGEPVTLHQTFLDGDRKANVHASKQVMPPKGGEGGTNGCAIRLFNATGDVLHIAEGIENSLAAQAMTSYGDVWACISAHHLEVVQIPKHYKAVEIWADSDVSGAGEAAAGILKRRLYREGMRAVIHMPPEGRDWLDIYAGKGEWADEVLPTVGRLVRAQVGVAAAN